MSEIQTWIFASVGAFAILSLITYGMAWEVQRRVRKLEADSTELSKRIMGQGRLTGTLEYIIGGIPAEPGYGPAIPNPNLGVKEIQKRVELILDKLGVEVDEGARLVEKEGE